MKRISILSLIVAVLMFVGCNTKKEVADRVLKNGTIYTVDEKNPNAEAIARKICFTWVY